MDHIRTALAVLLLAVVLPMTLVLPFHHHEEEESSRVSCDLCTHHQPHNGHLSAESGIDTCLICQFLGNGYLPERSAEAPSVSACHTDIVEGDVATPPSAPLVFLSPRAPPSSSC